MKNCFGAALAALALAAPTARANEPCGPCFPFKIEAGANVYFRILSNQNFYGAPLGPWYNYWPMEAHYQTPAMPHYPYWPSPMTLPGGAGVPPVLPYGYNNAPLMPVPTPAAPTTRPVPKLPPPVPELPPAPKGTPK